MVKVDNFKLIESLLFDKLDASGNDDNVIVGRIIRRKKENPDYPSEYIVKRYTFRSKEIFIERQDEIKKLCHMFNARFYISVNIKSTKDIAYDISVKVPHLIRSEQYYFFRRIFDDTADANVGVKGYRLWVFDIDERSYITPVIEYMTENYTGHLNGIVPTINGIHLLVDPHDTRYLNNTMIEVDGVSLKLKDMIDIKKNALTLAYYSDEEVVQSSTE